ncbi:MAG: FHA domain-containing protein [Planctomycetota bacterium]
MAKYSIRILDGVSKGDTVLLPADRSFSIGRKSGCDLQLAADDKVSGRHAEIIKESGMFVLRDLGSTNGTRVDGKRIQEIPISHGDCFQAGQTMLQLVDQEMGLPEDDLSLEIDAAMLKRSSRRGPAALLLLLLLLALAGGAWFLLIRESPAELRQAGSRAVVRVAGNLLSQAAAHLEEPAAAWQSLEEGGAFRRAGSGRTGRFALRADLGGEASGPDEPEGPAFAVGMLRKPLPLRRKAQYRLRAWVRSEGELRVGLRLCFFKDAKDTGTSQAAPAPGAEDSAADFFQRRPRVVVGPALQSLPGSEYQELAVAGIAPAGCKELGVALVAALPAGTRREASCQVDDISLVETGVKDEPLKVGGRSIYIPDADLSSFRVVIGGSATLSAVSAVPDKDADPVLAQLATLMPLPLPDVIEGLEHEEEGRVFRLRGKAGGALALAVPAATLAQGTYFVLRDEGFEEYSGQTRLEGVNGLLWGTQLTRALVRLEEPVVLDVKKRGDEFSFQLQFPGEVELQLLFQDEGVKAKGLATRAGDRKAAGELGEALKLYGSILRSWPYDDESLRVAKQERAALLLEAEQKLEALRQSFKEAVDFGYPGLFQGVLDAIAKESAIYDETEFSPRFAELRRSVDGRLASKQAETNKSEAAQLFEVQQELEAGKQKRLAALMKSYILEQYPGTQAAEALKGR